MEFDHKPLISVSSSQNLAVGGDVWTEWRRCLDRMEEMFGQRCLDRVDSSSCSSALYPHRLEVCLQGSFQRLEASTSV